MTFRIKKLDIFIAKQFGLLFVGTFFICQFVLMMQFVWRYVDELIGKRTVRGNLGTVLLEYGVDAGATGFAFGYPAVVAHHVW